MSGSGYSNDRTSNVNTDGERLDGPTIEQYVDAGYKAENYPPRGYAVKESPGWQIELERRTAPPVPQAPGAPTPPADSAVDTPHAPSEDEAADLGRPADED